MRTCYTIVTALCYRGVNIIICIRQPTISHNSLNARIIVGKTLDSLQLSRRRVPLTYYYYHHIYYYYVIILNLIIHLSRRQWCFYIVILFIYIDLSPLGIFTLKLTYITTKWTFQIPRCYRCILYGCYSTRRKIELRRVFILITTKNI